MRLIRPNSNVRVLFWPFRGKPIEMRRWRRGRRRRRRRRRENNKNEEEEEEEKEEEGKQK